VQLTPVKPGRTKGAPGEIPAIAGMSEEESVVDVRKLEPTKTEVEIICEKLDALQKLIVIHNRAFPTWATITLGMMGFAHVLTMTTLIWVVRHLP
jgi:hypothetical protein